MSSLTAPRVPLRRVFLTCGGVLAVEVALLLRTGRGLRATLLPGYAIILLAFGAVLALVCGVSPGWSRVEAWQAARFQALTAQEEAVAARRTPPTVGRHRLDGPAVRISWRTDRVVAAFLVLAFPPAVAAFSMWFVGWVGSR